MALEREKVFASNIIRTQKKLKNSLYDILKVVPAIPLQDNFAKKFRQDCNFVPSSGKYYVPKKKYGLKVRTVKDIRYDFELDVYSYLPADLERQKNLLLRKIRFGNAKDERTKELAKNILNASTPISKSAWQMIMNINPEENKFTYQYILWDGKCIQVNGSKGGKRRFIHKYDVGKVKENSLIRPVTKTAHLRKKKRLLQHSLNVKFKAGPLSKKKDLDTSYQKYHFGDLQLISLPKPCLDIQPSYGKPLAPFIHNAFLLNTNGVITEKWANFSVSVLGTIKNGIPVQATENCNVTFDLDYKCCQRRILMRQDSDITKKTYISRDTNAVHNVEDESKIQSEVYKVVNEILNSVEISLNQNNMFTGEDEPRYINEKSISTSSITQLKDKGKRKFGELGRLDVTVITIAETLGVKKNNLLCQNSHCRLGCICDSLKCSYSLRRHCGRLECMFKCTCDFSRYKLTDSFDDDCSDIIPGLVNFDKKLGETLAKEEHKFHQTVIVTNEKSIFLKSEPRNWKASKKYADFYSNMQLKSESDKKLILSIVCENLNLKHIEPWCMVHGLYRCFCKGKFTETMYKKPLGTDENNASTHNSVTTVAENDKLIDNINLSINVLDYKPNLRTRIASLIQPNIKEKINSDSNELELLSTYFKCARISPYEGRKYTDAYYHTMNLKILEMEKNDNMLRKKMIYLINKGNNCENRDFLKDNYSFDIIQSPAHDISQPLSPAHDISQPLSPALDICQPQSPSPDITQPPSSLSELLTNVIEHNSQELKECSPESVTVNKSMPKKGTLVSWLEASYKQYKQRASRGLVKTALDAPKLGKVALYAWDFMLGRYREKKNYFLISKQKPFRIFVAVNIKNNLFFDNCINISDIALSDLDKYPATIKNLLTNVTDLKDNFCILSGLSFCWELIGTVAKMNDDNKIHLESRNENMSESLSEEKPCSEDISNLDNLSICKDKSTDEEKKSIEDSNQSVELCNEQSKWFVMTIENDFREIQFYKKGFFVKYESVIKAASVAKRLGKTVRLSIQKCGAGQNGPQFGIYAIPSNKDNCVIIGPYEKDEPLGIETVKSIHDIKKTERSRGIWITTNKVDNLRVIDNPLLFMPSSKIDNDKMVTLESDTNSSSKSSKNITFDSNDIQQMKSKDTMIKVIKPITIKKSNSFYQLAPNGLLKQKPLLLNKSLLINNNNLLKNNLQNFNAEVCNRIQDQIEPIEVIHKPVAEIAPQLKECESSTLNRNRAVSGMFILKPEEINKRSFENKLNCNPPSQTNQDPNNEINMDIEKFLATSVVYPPNDEIFIISDDEDDADKFSKDNLLRQVWIVAQNIESLGWISGRRNSKNYLSFEFPGFKYSYFYVEEEAFNKINQVFARKVYIPSHITIQWQVVESLADLKIDKKLTTECLCSDYILTKKGLCHKLQIAAKAKDENDLDSSVDFTAREGCTLVDNSSDKESVITALEETSQTLDEENLHLWNETLSRKGEIIESFSDVSRELRKELTDKLNHIKFCAEEL